MTDGDIASGLTVSARLNADTGMYEFGVEFRDGFVVLGGKSPTVADLEVDAEAAKQAAAAPADDTPAA